MNTELLSLAKDLVQAMEKGDVSGADEILDKVAGVRETQLFQEVGRLTRQLHETIVSFSMDAKITAMAEHDFPDARDRLQYVISMTEQAADQTLTAVETLVPIAQDMNAKSGELSLKWSRFLKKDMPFDEFKAMSAEIGQHFQESNQSLAEIEAGLNTILMAQGFQDITGQIIRRVIEMVHELEGSMVNLISLSSRRMKTNELTAVASPELPGPVVPGIDDKNGEVATNQVDVDDLLSSLGF
jgi:chemotaxis protein CheZ